DNFAGQVYPRNLFCGRDAVQFHFALLLLHPWPFWPVCFLFVFWSIILCSLLLFLYFVLLLFFLLFVLIFVFLFVVLFLYGLFLVPFVHMLLLILDRPLTLVFLVLKQRCTWRDLLK